MSSVRVSVVNFERAESDQMFGGIAKMAGGVNKWYHYRQPTPIDQQTVIRMNRDTLYSGTIVDIADGAVLTVPDGGHRYVSVMVVNEDHYINGIFHHPGDYEIPLKKFDTRYVLLAARVLVDASDPADVKAVHAIQDGLAVEAASSQPFVVPDYDETSLTDTRNALFVLGKGLPSLAGAFGTKESADPVRHLIGTAMGWGGLPDHEATYINVSPKLPVGAYSLTVSNVPAKAFWSINMYNADGYFEKNDRDAYNVNSVTATKNDDGSVTVQFGGCGDNRPNCLPITEGWNFLMRLYQPEPAAFDGSWTLPSIEPCK